VPDEMGGSQEPGGWRMYGIVVARSIVVAVVSRPVVARSPDLATFATEGLRMGREFVQWPLASLTVSLAQSVSELETFGRGSGAVGRPLHNRRGPLHNRWRPLHNKLANVQLHG
jgi:hypothetical protein